MNDCNIIYITIYSSLIGLHEGAIQHKLESGYKPVKQQLSISAPHQALALSSSVSFPPLTHTSARWRCAGNRWWQGEAIFPNGPNTQQPAASQYNADLKHNKQTPTPTKIQTNSLPSSGTRSNIIAPVTDQCYRSSAEHTAPTAAAQAKGITLANRLVKRSQGSISSLGLKSASGWKFTLLGCLMDLLSQGFPNLICSDVPVANRKPCTHYRKAPAWQQQLLVLCRAGHGHSNAIRSGSLLSDECSTQARVGLYWAEDDKVDFFSLSYYKNTHHWAFPCLSSCCSESTYLRIVAQLSQSGNLSSKSLMLNPKLPGLKNKCIRNQSWSGRLELSLPLHILT